MNLRVQAENGCGLILPFVLAFFIYEWHLLIASVLFQGRLLKKESSRTRKKAQIFQDINKLSEGKEKVDTLVIVTSV